MTEKDYEQVKTDKVIQANMDALGRGEISPRLFEVYAKLSKQQSDLAQQITEMQNMMRKNYIDTYLDLQQKDDAEEQFAICTKHNEQNALTASEENINETSSNTIVGTENIIKMMEEKKKQALIAKFEEVK